MTRETLTTRYWMFLCILGIYRIDQLEREVRQGKAETNRLLEELAGIKIEKVPDDLLIH